MDYLTQATVLLPTWVSVATYNRHVIIDTQNEHLVNIFGNCKQKEAPHVTRYWFIPSNECMIKLMGGVGRKLASYPGSWSLYPGLPCMQDSDTRHTSG